MDWIANRLELSRGGTGHNLRPMEGLRGLAVLLVFLVHYSTLIAPWIRPHSALASFAESVHSIGNAGVDLFFVLSGYLIYKSLMDRPQPFSSFMGRRVARIYPAFLVVFVVYLFLSFLVPAQSKVPQELVPAVLYLIGNLLLLPGLFPIEPMISVAWSLSYEMFFYLLMPLVIACATLRQRSAAVRIGLFLVAGAMLLAYCVTYGGPISFAMFIAGMLLHEAMLQPNLRPPTQVLAVLALVAALAITLVPLAGPASVMRPLVMSAMFFAICFSCFREPRGWLGRRFSWTPLRWLGNMSYSYYLIHGLALKLAFAVLPFAVARGGSSPWLIGALLPAMFVLTIFPALALFLLVERPFSLGRRRRAEPIAAASAAA
jgi:peptidoglycan/LPS O-acetylase OafA/YrhL